MPQGNKDVINVLNDVLTGELTSINQYFLHSRMCRNWGYKRLAEIIYKESIDEMKHADELIERILYLNGVPNVQKLSKIRVGESVPEMFEVDLAIEMEAVGRLNAGIATCITAADNGSRHLLEELLVSEEEHVDWLEAQQRAIQQMGLAAYLSEQLKD
jgi:bacterioferritin